MLYECTILCHSLSYFFYFFFVFHLLLEIISTVFYPSSNRQCVFFFFGALYALRDSVGCIYVVLLFGCRRSNCSICAVFFDNPLLLFLSPSTSLKTMYTFRTLVVRFIRMDCSHHKHTKNSVFYFFFFTLPHSRVCFRHCLVKPSTDMDILSKSHCILSVYNLHISYKYALNMICACGASFVGKRFN